MAAEIWRVSRVGLSRLSHEQRRHVAISTDLLQHSHAQVLVMKQVRPILKKTPSTGHDKGNQVV